MFGDLREQVQHVRRLALYATRGLPRLRQRICGELERLEERTTEIAATQRAIVEILTSRGIATRAEIEAIAARENPLVELVDELDLVETPEERVLAWSISDPSLQGRRGVIDLDSLDLDRVTIGSSASLGGSRLGTAETPSAGDAILDESGDVEGGAGSVAAPFAS